MNRREPGSSAAASSCGRSLSASRLALEGDHIRVHEDRHGVWPAGPRPACGERLVDSDETGAGRGRGRAVQAGLLLRLLLPVPGFCGATGGGAGLTGSALADTIGGGAVGDRLSRNRTICGRSRSQPSSRSNCTISLYAGLLRRRASRALSCSHDWLDETGGGAGTILASGRVSGIVVLPLNGGDLLPSVLWRRARRIRHCSGRIKPWRFKPWRIEIGRLVCAAVLQALRALRARCGRARLLRRRPSRAVRPAGAAPPVAAPHPAAAPACSCFSLRLQFDALNAISGVG